jgi:oligopeptide transport system permease protein
VGIAAAYGAMVGRKKLELVTVVLTTLAQSLPSFVLGPLLVLAFAISLDLLPPAGWGTWRHVLLPALTLGTVLGAQVARLSYGGLCEIRRTEFVRTAYAKGLSPWRILRRHMLIPGLMPLVTYLGPAISGILVGSVATERIFCVPGLGPYLVDAAQNRDYFLIMGIVLLESVFLLSCNLAVDLVCAWLDPRIRMAGRP